MILDFQAVRSSFPSTNVNTSLTLSLADLVVEDTDHTYPDEHTLIVSEGDNYVLDALTVTPDLDFTGILTVPVKVSDGIEESETYNVEIEVLADAVLGTNSDEAFQFYPNPTADGVLRIKGIPDGAVYTLRDLSGRLHQLGEVSDGQIVMNVNNGTYFLEVLLNGESIKRKIMKN